MRILAVSTGERMQSAPEYPTLIESGFPVELQSWWAAMVPSATPRSIVDQIGKWISTVVASDEGRAFLASLACDAWVSGPDEAQAFFLKQIDQWGDYVRIAKIEQQG